MSWICGILPTFLSDVTSLFSDVFSSLFGRPEKSSVVAVDLELGGVRPRSKVKRRSGSLDQQSVRVLKVRETDSPRATILVPNTMPGKVDLGRTLEESSASGALTQKITIPTALGYTSSPSTESLSDDDRSSYHSVDSSVTSLGGGISDSGFRNSAARMERQPTRNDFYENCGATRSSQFGSNEVAEDCAGDEELGGSNGVPVDDSLAETVYEVGRNDDDGIYEGDPNVPTHRWLKFAIEFVLLHKLPNTISEMEEEGSEDAKGVREVEELDVVEQIEVMTPVPEVIELAPTPPPDVGQELIIDASLCRVREVTEDLVDLLASLKVAFPESPSSMSTSFTCNRSDHHHDGRPGSPNVVLNRNRLSREMDPEVCQWLRPVISRPGTSGSEVNQSPGALDDTSVICTPGYRTSPHCVRPMSAGRVSISDSDNLH